MSSRQPGDAGAEILDPTTDDFVRCPYDAYAWSRVHAPVVYLRSHDVWVVTGDSEIREILRNPRDFSSRGTLESDQKLSAECLSVLADSSYSAPTMMDSDAPDHTRLRNLVGEVFAPRNMAALEPGIADTARDLIRAMPEIDCDLLDRFAYPLPKTVICDVMGIPSHDRERVRRWHRDWLSLLSLPATEDQQVAWAHSVVAYDAYYTALLRDKFQRRDVDLAGRLATAALGDVPSCTLTEAVVALRFLLSASHETTANLIGNAALMLLRDRSLWQAVVADPHLIPAAVEESLRLDPSAQSTSRFTTRAVRLGSVEIPEGARVRLMLAAPGRDPDLVADPQSVDLRRSAPARHIAFSKGLHFCLGAPLARLEARIAFEQLAAHLPTLRLADDFEPEYRPGGFIFRGLAELRVAW